MTVHSGASGDDPITGDAAGDSVTSDVIAVPARRKRRRPWRTAFFALAAAGVIAGGGWVLLGSRLLAVRSVIVTGTHLVSRSEVLAVAGVERGMPLIRVNTGRVAARVDTIGLVRSAQVTRAWPDRVVIAVRERTAALALPAPGGGYNLTDADGVVLRRAARRPADLPLYLTAAAPGSLRGDPDLAAAAAVVGELPARLRQAVDSVAAPDPDQVTLRLAGGITVVWGGTDRAAAKARELSALDRPGLHYVDVSAPGSVMTR